ncbi:unnamed protein product [Lepeophtheirus salmonis]|uniref:(salmon louse) hypothetical protein n=1 Tax=Lepeophtheirus salmonis TaxID=72036 RepID=A0A7R8H5U6_LEPSM|nr:unnamed protein product [Lepeophtheirus salmonis]CAF2887228.1 unnamed protein product [Lepeophtheirus salmonis]
MKKLGLWIQDCFISFGNQEEGADIFTATLMLRHGFVSSSGIVMPLIWFPVPDYQAKIKPNLILWIDENILIATAGWSTCSYFQSQAKLPSENFPLSLRYFEYRGVSST